MGYHTKQIKKGELGELSKVQEELDELMDAHEQGVQVLCLCEASDLLGALQRYLDKYHPGMTIFELNKMALLTRKAFEDGSRK